jgi:hypothetical protein
MTTGRAVREAQRLARERPCPCGHGLPDHRELQPTRAIVDGELVETPHPDYLPGRFHCVHCACIR